jgi:hypothetical protein
MQEGVRCYRQYKECGKNLLLMWLTRFQSQNKLIFLFAVGMIIVLALSVQGNSGEKADSKIVAAGDGFVLTQESVDAYAAFFESQKKGWPQNRVVDLALKYELLSREYRNNTDAQVFAGGSEDVALQIAGGNKYIQQILSDWVVPHAVIESFYRANPEKYGTGRTEPDGRIIVKPLDETLTDEIRFMIIESKKEIIIKEFVDSLIRKYNIKIK